MHPPTCFSNFCAFVEIKPLSPPFFFRKEKAKEEEAPKERSDSARKEKKEGRHVAFYFYLFNF